jgi:heparanase 1
MMEIVLRPYAVSEQGASILSDDYLSLTIDTSLLLGGHWWGPSKRMRKGVAGELTEPLNLRNERLRSYARALAPAMLRIGGTEADRMRYRMGKYPRAESETGKEAEALPDFQSAFRSGRTSAGIALPDETSGLSHEFVLRKSLWKKLHQFIGHCGFTLLFTLSAGPADRDNQGRWKEDNARRLIAYSLKKKYPVAAWELGNEVNAFPFIHGVKHRVSGTCYAQDFMRLGAMVRGMDGTALLVGPASAVWPRIGEPNPLLRALCASPAAAYLDAASWHYYPQQSSHGRFATRRASESTMLSAQRLDEAGRHAARVGRDLKATGARKGPEKTAEQWVTETAHALYGGEPGLSDTFASTLWWLDELGLFARSGAAKVFRQALVGARYGLLDQDSMDPRPDYFASFLWKKLMGNHAYPLPAHLRPGKKIRIYVHGNGAVQDSKIFRTVLAINLSRKQTASLELELPGEPYEMERYLLTGDGAFTSRTLLLNGVRAGDDLIFDWKNKATRRKYRLNPQTVQAGTDGASRYETHLPPLGAIFLRIKRSALAKNS